MSTRGIEDRKADIQWLWDFWTADENFLPYGDQMYNETRDNHRAMKETGLYGVGSSQLNRQAQMESQQLQPALHTKIYAVDAAFLGNADQQDQLLHTRSGIFLPTPRRGLWTERGACHFSRVGGVLGCSFPTHMQITIVQWEFPKD